MAGALNFWLDHDLPGLPDGDRILVMDADSALDRDFIGNALTYTETGYHAVGGVFQGKDGAGFVGALQRNEYARYARDVSRKKGRTLVLTGTATIFSARCPKDVVVARRHHRHVPRSGGTCQIRGESRRHEDIDHRRGLPDAGGLRVWDRGFDRGRRQAAHLEDGRPPLGMDSDDNIGMVAQYADVR